jgi:uncharacterized membrane protein
MATVQSTIDVQVPVHIAYNQWTQFEEFPTFMEGVVDVTQLDDTHLRWVAEVGGKRTEWQAEITEQVPDQRIVWHSTQGKGNSGVVTFEPIDDGTTRVAVHMEYDTEGMTETLGSAIGFDDRQVKGDLERFKDMIESRVVETGAWRGTVSQTGR